MFVRVYILSLNKRCMTESAKSIHAEQNLIRNFLVPRETELYAKREEVWQQIEELARKKNPQFESLINQMDYLSLSQNSMNDHTVNEDDFSSDAIDHYSKDVSFLAIFGDIS